MKNALLELYKKNQLNFKKIKDTFPDDDLAGPFLMSPDEDVYSIQKNPLLIIGQETKGWKSEVDNIPAQMNNYEEFNVGMEYYSSPFWNVARKVENVLGNDEYSCAWTNINKFDLYEGRPYGKYLEAISTVDDILIDEINILKPKACIFFTGPSFDYRIKNIYKDVEFIPIEDWNVRQFCRLEHPSLPFLTFRTYHPKYLRIKYFEEDFIDFLKNSY